MKVAHVCLSNYYMDDRAYQENELVEEHARQGHEVLVIASTQVFSTERRREFVEPGRYKNDHGVEIIRLPYHPWVPHAVAKSLRPHRGVYQLLTEFCPDSILFHGMCGWELLTVSRYKKTHPEVKFYVDTHTDFINSAKGLISRWGLHFLYYRSIVHRCLPQIDKILFISQLTGNFARDFYGIPDGKLEFFPLGGHPVPDDEYGELRRRTRESLGLSHEHVLFMQSGKQSTEKKLLEALKAFTQSSDTRFRLVIAGSLLEDIREQAQLLIDSDERVQFLGWKTPMELKALLCATDVYLQPGSQSATMQTSLCCRCAPVLADIAGHEFYTKNTGWLLKSSDEIALVLKRISLDPTNLIDMKKSSETFSREKLDYGVLAGRILK
jgi:glycosyltransferase involved in cell wall biosynthesis